MLTVLLAGFGQGIAYPRLFNSTLGDVAPHQAGVAAGVLTSALQIGASLSVAAIGSLFFAVLGQGVGRDAYAHAFGIAQAATTAALGIAMLLSIPRRHKPPALAISPPAARRLTPSRQSRHNQAR